MWRVVAARAQGTAHRRTGSPCQDDFACETLLSGEVIVAVADGAGSAANSATGAGIAVRTTVSEVRRALEAGRTDYESLLREATLCARRAITDEAAEQRAEPGSYACTLLALLMTPAGGAALQIGDGVIVVNAGEADWRWVFWPQHGEYVNTTYFLTREDAPDRLQTVSLVGVSDFALTTDGLEPLVLHYATQRAHAPFFNAMFRPLTAATTVDAVGGLSHALEAFLVSNQITMRTDDDVTLALATSRSILDER